jgi:hypothetical protein
VVQDSFSLPLEVRERERARADPSPPALTDGGRVVICILVILTKVIPSGSQTNLKTSILEKHCLSRYQVQLLTETCDNSRLKYISSFFFFPVRPEADGLNGSNVLLLLYPCHKTTMLMVLKSLLKFSYYKHFKP